MATIISRLFTVELSICSEHLPRAAGRVIFNSDLLRVFKLSTGDVVVLASGGSSSVKPENFAVGIVWPALDISQDTIFVSSCLFLTAGLVVGDTVRVFPLSTSTPQSGLQSVQEAEFIELNEILLPHKKIGPSNELSAPQNKYRDWLNLAARELLVDLRYITTAQVIEFHYEGRLRRFQVQSIRTKDKDNLVNDGNESLLNCMKMLSIESPAQLWTVDWDCLVSINEPPHEKVVQQAQVEVLSRQSLQQAYASVGGLSKQIETIRDLLEIPLNQPELFRHFGLKPPRGILLHGPPGTGKTHLARAIASSTNSSVLVINGPELSSAYHGETESKLRDIFKQAKEKSPCIVVLDEIDALVPRREEGAGAEVEKRVVATLLTLLDGMSEDFNSQVIVIGTTNRPNAIDPALRRPGRFDKEIEIGVPDAEARLSILNVLLADTPHNISQDELHSLAARMYGYVGADIGAVVREAGTLAIKKWITDVNGRTQPNEHLKLELKDLITAMLAVRPSAMRSLFIETSAIYYSDIGGQASVIQKLKEAVEWPLLHPEAFQRLGVRPPKGVLLYGPPGCSKTVLARACACESGVNFVAVKGPELLNKFVGESERAVREIFRKARAASPSIIFFDEIDALATLRTSDTDRGSSNEGVLTSLLNEMDGVQELTGVTVIAATNRPEVIDQALMRPGRLDRILWVGPPDRPGREEILKIKTMKMSVASDLDIRTIAELTDGCSGAEISSLCQEAAILAMQKDMNAPHVPHEAFVAAARALKRHIKPDILERFSRWSSGCEAQIL